MSDFGVSNPFLPIEPIFTDRGVSNRDNTVIGFYLEEIHTVKIYTTHIERYCSYNHLEDNT